MNQLELKFSASLENAQLGTIAAARISRVIYNLITPDHLDNISANNSNHSVDNENSPNDDNNHNHGSAVNSDKNTSPGMNETYGAGEAEKHIEQFAADVEISVGEACTNAVKHSSHPDLEKRDIIVTFTIDSQEKPEFNEQQNNRINKKLIITVKDQNDEFDFDGVPLPDFNEFPESGYGIFIIKEKMDYVTYRHHDGWNIVTMIKNI